ncbi:MAG: type II toxin-antitoxin system VapC family toxin [Gammaproteobacteria bacterium]|nr:type II toxin-antitoxin system VapC family toxin [Gammaproteobacteria bacterium]MYG95451.1 type II toxin-antitoxin system VapC family toxin [Gammaproteobacteria bacterium]
MSAVLLDTHAWIWSLMAPSRLGGAAEAAIAAADSVFVSPISMYELTRKAKLGGWPEILPHLDELVAETETLTVPFTRETAARAALLDWRHRDPFDRFIAATAIELRCPLVSKDAEFDSLNSEADWPGRVWS